MSNNLAIEFADDYENWCDGEANKGDQDKRNKTEQQGECLGQFGTPPKMDDDPEDSKGELNETTPAKELNVNAGVTPAITKLRQSRTEFKVFSPSDQLFSPCTRKIEKSRLAGACSQPQVFRTRPPLLLPSHASALSSTIGCSTVGSNKMRKIGTAAPVCTPQRLELNDEEEEDEDHDDGVVKTEQEQQQEEALADAEGGEVDKKSI